MPCAELPTTLRCTVGSTVIFTVSSYHWLKALLDRMKALHRIFHIGASDIQDSHGSSLIFLPSDLASPRLSRSTKVTAICHPNCDSFNTERKNCFVINKYIKTTDITRNDANNSHAAPTLSKLSGPQNPSQIPGYH